MRRERQTYPTELILWILSFCFATSAALLFQKFLLPLVPSLHGGQGMLDGDSIYHHEIAMRLAERIRLYGWSEWTLFPAAGAAGNVAVLATLYVIFGNDPSLMIPINAAVHAFGGVLIYLIARELAPGETGRTAGLVAAVLFIGFPSALNWYGQVHKDGYSIAGFLLVIWAWIWARRQAISLRTAAVQIGCTLGSISLVSFVRPYNLIPLFAALIVPFLIVVFQDGRDLRRRFGHLSLYIVSLAMFATAGVWAAKSGTHETYTLATTSSILETLKKQEHKCDPLALSTPCQRALDWRWKNSAWLPKSAEGVIEVAARTRIGLIASGGIFNSGSMIDTDEAPDNILAVVAYAPRAIQIALFAPFPDRWFEKISIVRLVSIAEMLIWYVVAPGVVLALIYHLSSIMLMVMSFSLFFLYLYGFTIANIGTLYRVRYPFLFLFILIGVIGWTEYFKRRRRNVHVPGAPATAPSTISAVPAAEPAPPSRAGLLGAGAIVALFTGLGYFGLFLRDIVIARWFGVGAELDLFYLVTAIPMFLVAVLSMPLGTTLIPQFLNTLKQQSTARAQMLVSKVTLVYAVGALVAAAVLFAAAAPLLRALVGANLTAEKMQLAQTLLNWMLPIMLLSGIVIMNNALLNAMGRFTVPSAAQIVVPVASILALVIFGEKFGVVSVIAGLLGGQILNWWLVARALRKDGYAVRPAWPGDGVPLRGLLTQYLPLVATALLVNLTVPVNIGMASSLAEGSAAAFGLGSKMVMFITGLISAGVATVILPRFSSFMARNHFLGMRNELSFFLLLGVLLTVPVSIVLFAGAEFIVSIAFEGGAFTAADVKQVTRVMSYGIIQLPFYTLNLLMLNSAIATGHSWRVLIASAFALVVNIALNLVFMPHSGVAGIALAATISVALSALLMMLLFNRIGQIAWIDLIVIGLGLMLYTTLIISLQYHSYAGVAVTLIALLFLSYGQWNMLTRRHAAT
jgi:murein biosynthesis integral membrane protein MurJ